MRKKRFLCFALSITALIFTTTFGTLTSVASAELESRTMVFHYAGPLDCTNARFANLFKELVEAKSDGKLKIDVYGQNILGTDVDCFTTMKAGKVDFMVTTPSIVSNAVPALAVYDIPFTFDTVADARKALTDPEWLDVVKKEYEKGGYVLLANTDSNFRVISTNKEIKTFDDFNGMSLRTMESRNQIAFFNDIGIKATPLNASEVYIALQQGMLQGQENPYSQIYDKKLYEVQKFFTNSNHTFHNIAFFTGLSIWNSLSAEAQNIIQESATETALQICQYSDESEEMYRNKLINEYGMTYIDFDSILGLRDELRKATIQKAVERIAKQVPANVLDAYLKACGIEN